MLIWILILLREYIRDKKFLGTLYIENLLIVNYEDFESLGDFTSFRLLPYPAIWMTWMTIAAVFGNIVQLILFMILLSEGNIKTKSKQLKC